MVRIDIFKIRLRLDVLLHEQMLPVIVEVPPGLRVLTSKSLVIEININILPHTMLQQELSDFNCQLLNLILCQFLSFHNIHKLLLPPVVHRI